MLTVIIKSVCYALYLVLYGVKTNIMNWDEIKSNYGINDIIESVSDGEHKKYSGYLTLVGLGEKAIGYDSFNEDLVLYRCGKLAKVIIKDGIDHEDIAHMKHVENVMNTCRRLGCTTGELLHMNYTKELGYD